VEYGHKLGAAAVVVYSRYTNTVVGAIPLVLPNPPVTSTTTMQGSIIGSGGSATYTGTATTTTPGGYTAHPIPYHVDRYDQAAGYFVKAGKFLLGGWSRDLNPEERARLERNRGVIVLALRKDSPAFRGDLLRGDVVIEFAGEPVESENQFEALVPRHAGESVMIKIIRGGSVRELQVKLNRAD
jgi:S1-C subfamily serine protease